MGFDAEQIVLMVNAPGSDRFTEDDIETVIEEEEPVEPVADYIVKISKVGNGTFSAKVGDEPYNPGDLWLKLGDEVVITAVGKVIKWEVDDEVVEPDDPLICTVVVEEKEHVVVVTFEEDPKDPDPKKKSSGCEMTGFAAIGALLALGYIARRRED